MREQRFAVDFTVSLTWQVKGGAQRRARGRCRDLSAEGLKIEIVDTLPKETLVLVESNEFGRMGIATVRYCQRYGMKCVVGMKFSAAFGLGDPARKKVLDRILREATPDRATDQVFQAIA